MYDSWLFWAARWIVGVTLLLSGTAKLRDLAGFARGVHDYDLLPDRLVTPFAAIVSATEILLGILLLGGFLPPWPAAGALALFVLFAVAVLINLRRGRDISCYCMGTSSRETVGPATLVRLGLLILVTSLSVGHGSTAGGLMPTATRSGDALAIVLIVIYGCIALALIGPAGMLLGQIMSVRQDARHRKSAAQDASSTANVRPTVRLADTVPSVDP